MEFQKAKSKISLESLANQKGKKEVSARVKLKSPIFYQEVDSDGDTSGWSRLHPVEKKPLMSRRSKVHLKVVGVLLLGRPKTAIENGDFNQQRWKLLQEC